VFQYQKKHLAPVFNFRAVKNLYPLFWKKSSEMVSLIKAEIDTKPNSSSAITGIVNIDDWSGRIGLDIIGKAGFGSDFNARSNPHTPLNTSYRDGFIPDKASPNFSEYQSTRGNAQQLLKYSTPETTSKKYADSDFLRKVICHNFITFSTHVPCPDKTASNQEESPNP
jgi:hypothetical protein